MYSELKIINKEKFKILKYAEFGFERTTEKPKPKNIRNSSVRKSKESFAGSFPKYDGENPTKTRKVALRILRNQGKWRGGLHMSK